MVFQEGILTSDIAIHLCLMILLGLLQPVTAQPCAAALLSPVSPSKDQCGSVCPGGCSPDLNALVEPRTHVDDSFLVSFLPLSDWLVREPLGLPGNNHTCGILMSESAGLEAAIGNSKWKTLVWESSAKLIGPGILPSPPGF